MRIVSYNILKGGEGRADPIAEVIESQRPDVVALVEATDPAVLDRIARRLGMDKIHAMGKPGKGCALLSRFPIGHTINHGALNEDLTKCLVEASVEVPGMGTVVFGVLHLHHHAAEADEAIREKEIAAVLKTFEGLRKDGLPHVLLGDFNSNSPIQQIDPAALKPSSREQYARNGNQIPRRVIETLEAAGYVDTLQAARGDYARTAGSFTTQFPGQRVDYIFVHGIQPERVKDAWIEQDRLAKYASDHFPVGAEIV
jgi:endonuclease/exonuclease/phosphatase family metal-dependent hydrolase